MTSILPPFPKFVLTVFEPISLLAGFIGPIISPSWFITEQIANTAPTPSSENAALVAMQLGNVYLLLAMVGIAVLYSTNEAKVVRNYVWALWIADIGHVGITCVVLGWERTLDVGAWNAMTWGNVGVTVLLCLTRTAYLLGLFGPDRKPGLKAD